MLFRKQALENKSARITGDVFLLPRPSQVLMTLFITIWVTLLIVWLFQGSYKKNVSVLGWVESSVPVTTVYSTMSIGAVDEVYVENGQSVIEGQALFKLIKSTGLVNGSNLESQLIAELQKQYDDLEASYQRLLLDQPLRRELLESQLKGAKAELVAVQKQVNFLFNRAAIAKTEFQTYQALKQKGAVSQREVNAVEKEWLTAQSELQEQKQLAAELKGRVSELSSEKQLMPSLAKDNLSLLQQSLLTTRQQLSRANAEKQTIVTATSAGVISNVQISKGLTLNQSELAMSIVPQNASLKATLLVPVKNAGFLEVGQTVRIRYDAFPHQKFGVYSAKISNIAETVILPNEFLRVPIKVQEPMYQVGIVLESQTVNVYQQKVRLKPGMTLTARIILDERSLFEWFFEPFFNLSGRQ